jgi:hypothetical protein
MSKLPIHRAAKPKIKDKITRGLGNLPRVEIVRPWRGYAVGAIIQPPGVLRQVLVDKGYAVLVVDKPKRGRPKKVEVQDKPVTAETAAKIGAKMTGLENAHRLPIIELTESQKTSNSDDAPEEMKAEKE